MSHSIVDMLRLATYLPKRFVLEASEGTHQWGTMFGLPRRRVSIDALHNSFLGIILLPKVILLDSLFEQTPEKIFSKIPLPCPSRCE